MKICILSDHIPPEIEGGASFFAWDMARQFAKRQHEVVLITTTKHQEHVGVSMREGVQVHTLFSVYHSRWQAYISLWNPRVVSKIRLILKTFHPDVVHAHNIHGHLSYYSLWLAKGLGCRTLLTCHDVLSFNYGKLTSFIDPTKTDIPTQFVYRVRAWQQFREQKFRYNPFRNVLIRHILNSRVDQVVAVSDALADALIQNDIRPVTYIHNGINSSAWNVSEKKVSEFMQERGIGQKVILYAGRLSTIKGGLQVLAALPAVLQKVPSAQLLVVGHKDENTDTMTDYAKSLGVAHAVVYTDLLRGEALHAAFHAATVVIVPSICFDSFPTVILEAMAAHKPVIATCFGGSREALVHGETGYIVNPYNSLHLPHRLIELLTDTKKNFLFGKAGFERVRHKFALSTYLDAYEELYKNKVL